MDCSSSPQFIYYIIKGDDSELNSQLAHEIDRVLKKFLEACGSNKVIAYMLSTQHTDTRIKRQVKKNIISQILN